MRSWCFTWTSPPSQLTSFFWVLGSMQKATQSYHDRFSDNDKVWIPSSRQLYLLPSIDCISLGLTLSKLSYEFGRNQYLLPEEISFICWADASGPTPKEYTSTPLSLIGLSTLALYISESLSSFHGPPAITTRIWIKLYIKKMGSHVLRMGGGVGAWHMCHWTSNVLQKAEPFLPREDNITFHWSLKNQQLLPKWFGCLQIYSNAFVITQ